MAYIIGIAGGSASGKTTFIAKLKDYFSASSLSVLSLDHYYKPLDQQQKDANGEVNFDLPESIDMSKFLRDMIRLESGQSVQLQEYTFNHPEKEPEILEIKPAKVLVVEGLFIYEDETIASRINLKLFIDADDQIKFNRRLQRDSEERGLDPKTIAYQWENHVKPAFDKYLLPHKERVDMIIINNQHFENSLRVVVDHIQSRLNGQET